MVRNTHVWNPAHSLAFSCKFFWGNGRFLDFCLLLYINKLFCFLNIRCCFLALMLWWFFFYYLLCYCFFIALLVFLLILNKRQTFGCNGNVRVLYQLKSWAKDCALKYRMSSSNCIPNRQCIHLKSYLIPVNNSELKKGLKYYLEAPSISHLKYPRKLTAKDPRKGSRAG